MLIRGRFKCVKRVRWNTFDKKRKNVYRTRWKRRVFFLSTIIEFSHSRQQLFFPSSSLIIFFRSPTTWRQIGSLNFSRDAYSLSYSRLYLLANFDRRSSVFLSRRIARDRIRQKERSLFCSEIGSDEDGSGIESIHDENRISLFFNCFWFRNIFLPFKNSVGNNSKNVVFHVNTSTTFPTIVLQQIRQRSNPINNEQRQTVPIVPG